MELAQAKLKFHKKCFVCACCAKGLVGVPYKLQVRYLPPLPFIPDLSRSFYPFPPFSPRPRCPPSPPPTPHLLPPCALQPSGTPPLPLCMDCWLDAHGEVCTGCGERIRGGVLKVNGRPWHKECHAKAKPAASAGAKAARPTGKAGAGKAAVAGKPAAAKTGKAAGRSVASARTTTMSLGMDYASLE